jgi:hypothetical protein
VLDGIDHSAVILGAFFAEPPNGYGVVIHPRVDFEKRYVRLHFADIKGDDAAEAERVFLLERANVPPSSDPSPMDSHRTVHLYGVDPDRAHFAAIIDQLLAPLPARAPKKERRRP